MLLFKRPFIRTFFDEPIWEQFAPFLEFDNTVGPYHLQDNFQDISGAAQYSPGITGTHRGNFFEPARTRLFTLSELALKVSNLVVN